LRSATWSANSIIIKPANKLVVLARIQLIVKRHAILVSRVHCAVHSRISAEGEEVSPAADRRATGQRDNGMPAGCQCGWIGVKCCQCVRAETFTCAIKFNGTGSEPIKSKTVRSVHANPSIVVAHDTIVPAVLTVLRTIVSRVGGVMPSP